MKTGAQLIIEALQQEGVEHIFGYPGGKVIPIFDALFKQDKLNFILTRHEQGAVHAADGYARSTGKIGVCLVTSGPGATNTVTGIATANFDSVPIIVFTGQVSTMAIGDDAFQEADIIGITQSITKHSFIVTDRAELGRTIKEAFHIAINGRPGPVLIDLPVNVVKATMDDNYADIKLGNILNNNYPSSEDTLKESVDMLLKAQRPVFFIGGGVNISDTDQSLTEIAEKTDIPVISTLMGLGAFRSDHPLFLGMAGMHGTYTSNMALTEADLIYSIGLRFDDRITGKLSEFATKAKIVHIDIDPSSISRNVKVDVEIMLDAGQALKKIKSLLPQTVNKDRIAPWLAQLKEWQANFPLKVNKGTNYISNISVIKSISKIFDDAIIVTDVGQHQMWTAQFYNFTRKRTLITSGGLGTMGFGFPAAFGVKMGNPDTDVVCITGDGSFQMLSVELATVAHNEIPVKIILLNNQYLGMVRQWQDMFFQKNYAGTCLRKNYKCEYNCNTPGRDCIKYIPDFMKLVDAYGIKGYRCTKEEEVEAVFREIKGIKDQPVFVELITEPEENVLPLVPEGDAIYNMITE